MRGKIRSVVALGVVILLVGSVFGVALASEYEVDTETQETLTEGGVVEENPTEIHDWYDLHEVRDNLDDDYVLMNDLDENTEGYKELASDKANKENEFDELLGSSLGNDAGDRFMLSYTPLDELLVAEDDEDGSEVEIEIINADAGKIELKEDTEANLYIEYKTTEEIALGWDPIGYYESPLVSRFRGTFNGGGREIRGLYINRPDTGRVGLFVSIGGGSVSDVGLVDVDFTGDHHVGGLVGRNYRGTISSSYAIGSVSGDSKVGGLVGQTRDIITNSYAAGNVTGNTSVGGLAGMIYEHENPATVINSYAVANVTGDREVGGLVGYNYNGTVDNSYATGNVDGDDRNIGGLVGWNWYATVSNSYATGEVKGDSNVGGLVGPESLEGTIENSFWDIERTGQDDSDGGTGKTREEMKDVATYTDTATEGLEEPWDFVGDPNDDEGLRNIWHIDESEEINEGYPFQSWQDVDMDIHRLEIGSEGEGSIEIYSARTEIPYTGYYEEGEGVDLKAIPDEGWFFDEWTGDVPEGEEGEEITITMNEDKSITAHFEELEEYDLTIGIEGEGSTEPEEGTHTYYDREEVTVEATPIEGWEFVEWNGDYEGEEKEITITMDEDKWITAHFEEDEEEDDGVPGFTSTLLLLATVIAVAIYHKKEY